MLGPWVTMKPMSPGPLVIDPLPLTRSVSISDKKVGRVVSPFLCTYVFGRSCRVGPFHSTEIAPSFSMEAFKYSVDHSISVDGVTIRSLRSEKDVENVLDYYMEFFWKGEIHPLAQL